MLRGLPLARVPAWSSGAECVRRLSSVLMLVGCLVPWGHSQSSAAESVSAPPGTPQGAVSFPRETQRHLEAAIARQIAEPKVARAHWGVAVAQMDGTPLYGLNEGHFFQPASNAKLFTTAAAMTLLGPERTFETRVLVGDLSGQADAAGSSTAAGALLLVGGGDANFAGTDVPYVAPVRPAKPTPNDAAVELPDALQGLVGLADQVVASGVKVVPGDVIGDDTIWPWQPYPQDWTIDDAVWGYGAPVSALSVDDNQMRLVVTPAERVGEPAGVVLQQAVPYYTMEAGVLTTAPRSSGVGVSIDREPGSRVLRVYGHIAADAKADVEEIAIADPAEYAAMVFKSMLEARGVEVRGGARALHRQFVEEQGFLRQTREPLAGQSANQAVGYDLACVNDCELRSHAGMKVVATHRSATLAEDVLATNKLSQNLHAELMLRQMGAALGGGGTAAQGVRVLRSFLVTAGVDPEDVVMYDGSGLSGHDLVTPRATVRLLSWASGQPWFAAWRASLPVGGVDGTLEARFVKGPLKGKVFAKTGTLGEARALSGYVVCASGRTVAFSVMVTDHAPGDARDREVVDRIVEAIAAAE